jgi:hypothetical protein
VGDLTGDMPNGGSCNLKGALVGASKPMGGNWNLMGALVGVLVGALVGVAATGALVGAGAGALVGLAGSALAVGAAGVGAFGADGATGAAAAAPPMGGATGAEGTVGAVWYLAQQRGMGRLRAIQRRRNFLPRRVLQKSADEGAMQVSSTVKAKKRVEYILVGGSARKVLVFVSLRIFRTLC